jgi:hypothetical protein
LNVCILLVSSQALLWLVVLRLLQSPFMSLLLLLPCWLSHMLTAFTSTLPRHRLFLCQCNLLGCDMMFLVMLGLHINGWLVYILKFCVFAVVCLWGGLFCGFFFLVFVCFYWIRFLFSFAFTV